jgi:selenide,water dikinase
MQALNRSASEAARRFEIHAATDVTGFGLLGHAREMAIASKVSLVIDSGRAEFLPEARDYAREGFLPGGLKRNVEFIAGCAEFSEGIPEETRNLLFDPQTSGGLLFAVASGDATRLVRALGEQNIPTNEVGKVVEKTRPLILVR